MPLELLREEVGAWLQGIRARLKHSITFSALQLRIFILLGSQAFRHPLERVFPLQHMDSSQLKAWQKLAHFRPMSDTYPDFFVITLVGRE